jgi:hypothetical protein
MATATLEAMEQPKTLEELAAEASRSPDGGWTCPRCECRHLIKPSYKNWDVANTYALSSGNTRRNRICRNCGQASLRTEEVPVPPGSRVVVVPLEGSRDDLPS